MRGCHAPKLPIPNKMWTERANTVEAVDRHDASQQVPMSIVEAKVGDAVAKHLPQQRQEESTGESVTSSATALGVT